MAPFICKYSPISTVLLLGPKRTPSLVQLIPAASFNRQCNSSESPGATAYDSGWEIWYLVGGSAEQVGERRQRQMGRRERREGPTKVSGGQLFPGRHCSCCTNGLRRCPALTTPQKPGSSPHSDLRTALETTATDCSQQKLSCVSLFPHTVNRALKKQPRPEEKENPPEKFQGDCQASHST